MARWKVYRTREGARRGGMIRAGSVGRRGVVFGADVGTSSMLCVFPMSLDVVSDPGSCGHPNPVESKSVFSIVGVFRPCRMLATSRVSRNSTKSGTLSNGMGLLRTNQFRTVKRDHISAKIVSILAE